jgi:hypothetical protein
MKRIAVLLLALLPVVSYATVTTQTTSASFTCTGSSGPYPFLFPISDASALTVAQDGIVLSSSSYTVSPVNNNYTNGGSVTLNATCPSGGNLLLLRRVTPLTQTMVFTDNMPVPMKSFERGLDKLTEIVQEQSSSIDGIPFCSGFTPTVGQTVQYATPVNAAPCWQAANLVTKILPGFGVNVSPSAGTGDVTISITPIQLCPPSGDCIIDGSLEVTGPTQLDGPLNGTSASFSGTVAAGATVVGATNNALHPAVCGSSVKPIWCPTTGSQDIGAWTNAAVQASSLTVTSQIVIDPGVFPIITPIVIDRPVALITTGATLVPQYGGAGGVWGSQPVTISGCTMTPSQSSSYYISCPSIAGLSQNMRIGGIGVLDGTYINGAPSGTTIPVSMPPYLTLTGIGTLGSPVLTQVSQVIGLSVGQSITGYCIPTGATIASINSADTGSGQSITMSANAICSTYSTSPMTTIFVKSAWTGTITAQAVQPVIVWAWNPNAELNPGGQNIHGSMTNVTIVDPGASTVSTMTATAVTASSGTSVYSITGLPPIGTPPVSSAQMLMVQGFPSMGNNGCFPVVSYTSSTITVLNPSGVSESTSTGSIGGTNSVGRCLTGVQGIQEYGWDNLTQYNTDIKGLLGAGEIYGGNVPSASGSHGTIRESENYGLHLYDSGAWQTGQGALELMTGLGASDELNQLHFNASHVVGSEGVATLIGSYLPSDLPGSGGPRLIWFENNYQIENINESSGNFAAAPPRDLVVMNGYYIHFIGGELSAPGYAKSVLKMNAIGVSVNASLVYPNGKQNLCTVTLSNSSTTVGYQSCTYSIPTLYFDRSGAWNGEGVYFTNSTTYAITSVSITGATATYNGSFPDGGSNALVGARFVVSGFTHSGNNSVSGYPYITSSSTTQIVVSNALAVNETNSATATIQWNSYWAASGAVTSLTTANLAAGFAGPSGTYTMTVGTGGYYYNAVRNPNNFVSLGNTYNDNNQAAISLLGATANMQVNSFTLGLGWNSVTPTNLISDYGATFNASSIVVNSQSPTPLGVSTSSGGYPFEYFDCPNIPSGYNCAMWLGLTHNPTPANAGLGSYLAFANNGSAASNLLYAAILGDPGPAWYIKQGKKFYSANNTIDDGSGNSTLVGQLNLTVPTGTAPLAVASTTKVNNLNVAAVNGITPTNTASCLQGFDTRPCSVANTGILSYSGTTSPSQITLVTPSAQYEYEVCGFVIMTGAGTAGTISLTYNFTASGISTATAISSPTVTSLGSKQAICYPIIVDASTSLLFQPVFSGVTGSPSIAYYVDVKRLN